MIPGMAVAARPALSFLAFRDSARQAPDALGAATLARLRVPPTAPRPRRPLTRGGDSGGAVRMEPEKATRRGCVDRAEEDVRDARRLFDAAETEFERLNAEFIAAVPYGAGARAKVYQKLQGAIVVCKRAQARLDLANAAREQAYNAVSESPSVDPPAGGASLAPDINNKGPRGFRRYDEPLARELVVAVDVKKYDSDHAAAVANCDRIAGKATPPSKIKRLEVLMKKLRGEAKG